MQWDQCRRFYNFLMADNMKKIILSHRYRTLPLSVPGGTLAPPTKMRQGTSSYTVFTQLEQSRGGLSLSRWPSSSECFCARLQRCFRCELTVFTQLAPNS